MLKSTSDVWKTQGVFGPGVPGTDDVGFAANPFGGRLRGYYGMDLDALKGQVRQLAEDHVHSWLYRQEWPWQDQGRRRHAPPWARSPSTRLSEIPAILA